MCRVRLRRWGYRCIRWDVCVCQVRQWADFGVVGIGPLVLAPLSEIQGRNPVYFISFFITASKCTVKTMLMGSDVYSAGDVQEYSDHLGCSVCIWIECVGGGDDGRRDDI